MKLSDHGSSLTGRHDGKHFVREFPTVQRLGQVVRSPGQRLGSGQKFRSGCNSVERHKFNSSVEWDVPFAAVNISFVLSALWKYEKRDWFTTKIQKVG